MKRLGLISMPMRAAVRRPVKGDDHFLNRIVVVVVQTEAGTLKRSPSGGIPQVLKLFFRHFNYV
jgi:hypothetical protein